MISERSFNDCSSCLLLWLRRAALQEENTAHIPTKRCAAGVMRPIWRGVGKKQFIIHTRKKKRRCVFFSLLLLLSLWWSLIRRRSAGLFPVSCSVSVRLPGTLLPHCGHLHSTLYWRRSLSYLLFPRIAPPPLSPRGCKSCGGLSPDWLAGLPLNARPAHVSLTAPLCLSASPSARTGLLFNVSDVKKEKKKKRRRRREGQGASRLDCYDFNPSVARLWSPPPPLPPPTCDIKRIM